MLRTGNPGVDLILVLKQARAPLSPVELERRLGLDGRSTAYLLLEARRRGHAKLLADGRYAYSLTRSGRRPRPATPTQKALQALLLHVLKCEAEWRLDDRLDALDRARRRSR